MLRKTHPWKNKPNVKGKIVQNQKSMEQENDIISIFDVVTKQIVLLDT